mmetsp:Transcript_102369/g.159692  ORF Transcript_102369/g.159692 Transcript_102369/m.159692 type:complete len:202 (+) Transcript_102369:66-671(+)
MVRCAASLAFALACARSIKAESATANKQLDLERSGIGHNPSDAAQRLDSKTGMLATLLFALNPLAERRTTGSRSQVRRKDLAKQSRIRSDDASMQMVDARDRIDEMVKKNNVFLFMKGTPTFPQCGFSRTAVELLSAVGVPFETFDVLSDESIREGVKKYSDWPTIPQCYIEGEFIGGTDIMIEMYQNGELQEMLERAAAS